MYECASWLVLLLMMQWFFGNLYEAIVIVPNALSLIELNSREGQALFPAKGMSPAAYYLPPGSLGSALMLFLVINSYSHHRPGTSYAVASCVLALVSAGLTLYIVRYISLDLFFKAQTDLLRAQRLLGNWTKLNYIRMAMAGASVPLMILSIRVTIKG